MSDTITISSNEFGVIRVFAIDLTNSQIANFDATALAQALGVAAVDGQHYDIYDVADLDELGLADTLIEAYGIAQEDIDPMRPQLTALTSYVLILPSKAVNATDQTLTPTAPLRWIATFNEDKPAVNFEPLPNPDPEAVIQDPPQKKQPSDAAMGGRVATIVLLVLAALVWVMIRIAG